MKQKGAMCGVFLFLLVTVGANADLVDGLVGFWEFDNPSNLGEATIGRDLITVGSAAATAGYKPGDGAAYIGVGSYFKMDHRIPPNGGGGFVNIWTLLIDFKYPTRYDWIALYQTSKDNRNDADCFVRYDGAIGVGETGFTSIKTSPNVWYRVVVTVYNPYYYRIYINGQLGLNGAGQPKDKRFSLDPYLLLFADENGEDRPVYVTNVAIWNRALSAAEVAALGTVGTPPIPEPATVLLLAFGLISFLPALRRG